MNSNTPTDSPEEYKGDVPAADAWLRSIAGAVPYVGTALGELLTRRWTRVREDRVREAFSALGKKVAVLGESKLDKQYVESDEFLHVLTVCLEGLVREQDARKRSFFVNLMANAMTAEMAGKRTRAEWFASTLTRMSYFHLIALTLVAANQSRRVALLQELEEQPGDNRAVATCLRDLVSAGFLSTSHPTIPLESSQPLVASLALVHLTDSGSELVEWLSSPQ